MKRRPARRPTGRPTSRPSGRFTRRLPAWTSSLYWKFAVFITLMCCVLAAVIGVLVHVSVTRQTLEEARRDALTQLDTATRRYVAGEALRPGTSVDPADLPPSLRKIALSGKRGTELADHRGQPTMWAAGPADGGALAVPIDYSQASGSIKALDQAIVGSSAMAIGLTLLAGFFAVSRVTGRLHRTAQVARRISAGDLDARVGDPRTRRPLPAQDEVAAVSGALDELAGTLQDRLQSEQRFTADVAHELRTPLTGLHAAAELLPPGRPTQLVQDRVATLRRLTEDLLEISRLDADAERAEFDAHPLGRVAERAAHSGGLETEVRIVRDAMVETDARRLERVLGNLIANAHKHGARPVVVTVDGPRVTVRDHGRGFPDYLLERGPQRFRTETERSSGGPKGHGLGLTIAVGQARTLGAELRFQNAPDGGATAVLVLPATTGGPDGAHPDGGGRPGRSGEERAGQAVEDRG
ncbi:ATP-binding protein [Streptomyces pathocidini]|uniref:ATP-binding protein n=1 Tax=Streptomyces pathocidini TaxID=1650571 RepID=UPI003F4D3C3A